MDWERFQTRLDAFLDGALSADERYAAETHLASCARCRELRTLMTPTPMPSSDPAVPTGLTASILKRTSGAPCECAHRLLADYVDGGGRDVGVDDDDIDILSRELVRSHLEHCQACAAVAGALSQLAADLPAFASLQPDPGLVHDVLAITHTRKRRWAGVLATSGLSTSWARLLARPRIAMEAGYVAAVMLWLVLGASSSASPLRAAAPRLVDVVRQNPVELARRSGATKAIDAMNAINTFGRSVASVGHAWQDAGERTVGSARAMGKALADQYRVAEPAEFEQHWRDLVGAVRDFDGQRIVGTLRALGDDVVRLWDQVVSDARPQRPQEREER